MTPIARGRSARGSSASTGRHANQVIWFGAVPLMGDVNYANEGLAAMDRWLAGVESDGAPGTLAQKIIRDKPARRARPLLAGRRPRAAEPAGASARSASSRRSRRRYGTPRTVAGEGIETDVNKCTLKPLRRSDYYPIAFTDAQWAKLVATFPTGVCDWSRPGVSQYDTIPWQTYQSCVGAGDLRRPAARRGPGGLGTRLDERRVRLLARLAGARRHAQLTRWSRGPQWLPAPSFSAETAKAGERSRRCDLWSA